MSREDLERAISWAAAEGWNPGIEDVDTFYAIDSEGYLMGWLGDRPIGSISAVDWGDGFGFIGLYIVLPEMRGRGYGIKLWQAAMDRLKEKIIGLDGVLAQQENYSRSGFSLAHRNLRFEGKASLLAGDHYGDFPQEQELERLQALDVAPAQRSAYLSVWLRQPQAIILGGNESLIVCRPCLNGYKIGPLVAPSSSEAGQLLRSVCAKIAPDSPVFLDVPETNPQAVELAGALGMNVQFETARMYSGGKPDFDHSRWFGVTTFELG